MSVKNFCVGLFALLGTGLVSMSASAFVSIANCDDVPHEVEADLAGEHQRITLAPGQRYQTFIWPARFSMAGKEPRGYITSRQPRRLDEYCIWSGEIRLQRRRTSLYSH